MSEVPNFTLKNEHSTGLLQALGQAEAFKKQEFPNQVAGQIGELLWHKVNNDWQVWLPLAWVKNWFELNEGAETILHPIQVKILEAMAFELRNSPVSLYNEKVFVSKVLRPTSRLELMRSLEELLQQLRFILELSSVLKNHYQVVMNLWLSGQGDELSSSDQQFQEITMYFAKLSSLFSALTEIGEKLQAGEKFMSIFIKQAKTAPDKQDVVFQEAVGFLELMTTELGSLATKITSLGQSLD